MHKRTWREVGFAELVESGKELQLWHIEGVEATSSAVGTGELFVGKADGTLQKLEAKTGKVLWSASLRGLPVAGVKLHETWVMAWDLAGEVMWCERGRGHKVGRIALGSALAGAPCCVGSWMVLGGLDGGICRVQLADGVVVWSDRFAEGLRLAPVCDASLQGVSEIGEGLLLGAVSSAGRLLVWDALTGTLLSSRLAGLSESISIHVSNNADFFVVDRAGQASVWSLSGEVGQFLRDNSQAKAHQPPLVGVMRSKLLWAAEFDAVLGTWNGELVRRNFAKGQDLWRVRMPDRLQALSLVGWEIAAVDCAGSTLWIDGRTGRVMRALRLSRTPSFTTLAEDGALLVADLSGGLALYRSGWWKRPSVSPRKRHASVVLESRPSLTLVSNQTTMPKKKATKKPPSSQPASLVERWYDQWMPRSLGGYRFSWLSEDIAAQKLLETWLACEPHHIAMRSLLSLEILEKWRDDAPLAEKLFWLGGLGTLQSTETTGLIELLCGALSEHDTREVAGLVLVALGKAVLPSLWAEMATAGMSHRVMIQGILHKLAQEDHEIDLLGEWNARCRQVFFHPDAAKAMLEMLLGWPDLTEAKVFDATISLQGVCSEPTAEMRDFWKRLQGKYASLRFDLFGFPKEGEQATFFSAESALEKAEKRLRLVALHDRGDAGDTGFFADRIGPMSAYTSVKWTGRWTSHKTSRNDLLATPKAIAANGKLYSLDWKTERLSCWTLPTQASQGLVEEWSIRAGGEGVAGFVVWGDSLLLRNVLGHLSLVNAASGEVYWEDALRRGSGLLLVEDRRLYTCRLESGRWHLRAEDLLPSRVLKKAWEVEIGDERPYSMIIAHDGRVVWNSPNGTFQCHEAKDGAMAYVRKYRELAGCWMIGAVEGVLFANKDGIFGLLDEDGRELWREIAPSSLIGAPVYAEGVMYVATEGGELLYVKVHAERSSIFSRYKGWGALGTPVVVGQAVYVCDLDGQVYALHRKINEELWRIKVNERLSWRSAVVVDKMLLAFDVKGGVHLLA